MRNQSFVLNKPNEVVYEDRPVPELSSPFDVLIEVKFTGICGSDVHYYSHGAIGPFVVKAPMVLGHESAGIVTQVGSSVTTLQPGDRVAMEPGIPCRRCIRCKEGTYNLCPSMAFAATPPYDGTLAKYYVLPEDFCVKLPDHMTLEEGALVEPASVGVHACRQAAVRPGSFVVVFGAGPVGLLCMATAKAFGASKIVAVDINEDRLQFAKRFAATGTFTSRKDENPEQGAARLIRENDLAEGADAVIDATGAPPCIATGIHVTRGGGTYCQVGMGPSEITFPLGAMAAKEMTMRSSFRYGTGDYRLAVDLIASGKVVVKDLITNKVKFANAKEAFDDVKAGRGIKTLIEGPSD